MQSTSAKTIAAPDVRRRSRLSVGAALLVGVSASVVRCYEPELNDCTVACGAGDACPAGQRCDHGFCSASSSCRAAEHDAASDGMTAAETGLDGSHDGSVDVPPPPFEDASSEVTSGDVSSGLSVKDASSDIASRDASSDASTNQSFADVSSMDAPPRSDAPWEAARPCEPLALPFPSTPVLDDMNRTTPGPNWRMPFPTTLELDGMQAVLKGPADAGWRGYEIVFQELFADAQEAYVTFLTFAGSYIGLELRVQETWCNKILVTYTNLGDITTVVCTDGYWTELQRKRVTLKSGDVVGARVQTNGCVEVYVGGALFYAVDASPVISTLKSPSRIGVWGSAAAGTSTAWDDFGGGSLH